LSFLRYIRLLSLALWIGSIFFFAAVLAPTVFSVLPSRTLAGQVVSHSLFTLHWIGIACGLAFFFACVLLAMFQSGQPMFHLRDLLLVAMVAITLCAHFGIERKMETLRNGMGVIENVPKEDVRRVEFNRLHVWSERMEGSVFVCGLILFFLVVREPSERDRWY
jgi:hypothetical protein